jgi:uncharacterized protein YdaT
LKTRLVIKEGDFSLKHADNSEEVNEESQASDKLHSTSTTMDTKKGSFLQRKLLINRKYMN